MEFLDVTYIMPVFHSRMGSLGIGCDLMMSGLSSKVKDSAELMPMMVTCEGFPMCGCERLRVARRASLLGGCRREERDWVPSRGSEVHRVVDSVDRVVSMSSDAMEVVVRPMWGSCDCARGQGHLTDVPRRLRRSMVYACLSSVSDLINPGCLGKAHIHQSD